MRRTKLSSKVSISSSQKKLLTFIAVISFIFQALSMHLMYKTNHQEQIDNAKIYGESVASGIKLIVNSSLYITQSMENLYLHNRKPFLDEFDMYCTGLGKSTPSASEFFIAPCGIISHAWPEEIKDSTIGFNLIKDTELGEKSVQAISTREITVAGPNILKNGKTGFIIRNPIFTNGKFEAFSVVVLDWNKFVQQIISEVDTSASEYDFGVWKKNNRHTYTDEYGFIFTDCNADVSKDLSIKIPVPNDIWYLSVEPVSGWITWKDMIPETLVSLALTVLVILLFYIRMRDTAKKFYAFEHDKLTGVLNREGFFEEAKKILKNNPEKSYDVLLGDINNFKMLNSIYGTAVADKLLKYLAVEFKKLEPYGIIGRYGGDSFISLFPTSRRNSKDVFLENSKNIISNAPIKNFKINYGFYGNIDHTLPINTICDRVLFAAKSIKRNYEVHFANYNGPVSKIHMKEQLLESSFSDALAADEFKVWFQPKFSADEEKLVGAEALVRWIQKDGTVIPPVDFIPLFERNGLIVKLDEYVFTAVCSLIRRRQEEGKKIIPISINVSRASLHHSGLIQKYKEIIKSNSILPDYVPLELTETYESSNLKLKELTATLKQEGFKIHMDDFGTGLSSLSCLNLLPFDVIKLDKSLIDFIGNDGGDEILRHTIELAHFKKMNVVAEGVETEEQLDFLRKLHCDIIQGYYFSKPRPYDDFIQFIDDRL
ncbi:EAL domain-containing protein [Treponema rectale]|uniref:Diguanylate cyclase (GGDEF)-like protein n=1 Tax=Treponema rectale TaxID=744512 RepID=A0A840SEI5_9SPIR|nr:diguanylate cyclase (GGDEF)-like protein [Treponema rectale]QOS40951.1 EAL domain-containing protein [Treponema rectale]